MLPPIFFEQSLKTTFITKLEYDGLKSHEILYYQEFTSDFGKYIALFDKNGFVYWLSFGSDLNDELPIIKTFWQHNSIQPKSTSSSMSFTGLVLKGTPFQQLVWKELLKTSKGESLTYKKIAEAIHFPNASQAVGNAVGSNSIAVLVPCHRAMARNRKITKFRWGKELKVKLLTYERENTHLKPNQQQLLF